MPAYMSDAKIGRLSQWFSQANDVAGVADQDENPHQTAPDIAAYGTADPQIAACNACHDPTAPARPEFPVLAGQHADYLATQLEMFADDAPHNGVTRGAGPCIGLMQRAAKGLTKDEIDALAHWFSAQP